jgi:hypothetical protein
LNQSRPKSNYACTGARNDLGPNHGCLSAGPVMLGR